MLKLRMDKRFRLFFIVLLFAMTNILSQSQSIQKNLNFSTTRFYFFHQIFADAFYMTTLNKDVTTQQIWDIVNEAYYKLTVSDTFSCVVSRTESPNAILKFQIGKAANGDTILVLKTNFVQQSKTFIGDLSNENLFVRMYFIKKNRLVYRKDLFSEAEEANRIKAGIPTLAEYYLFDDIESNDVKAKELLANFIKDSTATKSQLLYAKLHLAQYYLSVNDLEHAQKLISDLNVFYKENESQIPKGYGFIVKLANLEFELNKKNFDKYVSDSK